MAKRTIKEVADTCMSEGLGYAVQHYLDHEAIEDQKLAKLWREASEALALIEALFVEHLGVDWEEQC